MPTGHHPTSSATSFPIHWILIKTANPEENGGKPLGVDIGNDVWIGRGATIMPGVSVGHGAIIGTGAVVTRDVQPYAVVGGVPARLIRYRFPAETIAKLLAIRWWDWDDEKIKREAGSLTGPIEPFIDKHFAEL